ncbi:MAG: hypothetical protein IKU44_05580 [Firmicutes bacterium]|nr:hypothetical protein [Bacillota bacterium]
MIPQKLYDILEKAKKRERLTKEECKYILSFPAESLESSMIRSVSNELIREKMDNSGIVIGQVGVDIHPCKANCGFCSLGEEHACIPTIKLDKPALEKAIKEFTRDGDLYGLYLMTMADTDQEYLLDMVRFARSVAPADTQIWVNTGDNEKEFYEKLVEAGAVGAYHVCRVGEGVTTKLDPEQRVQTMKNIIDAGLELYSCVEPIGPETSIDELVEKIYVCIDLGVTQFGAMKRVAVPGSPLAVHGEISNLQMAHVMGCVGLVYGSVENAKFFGVHEPCESGYLAGANFATAETGVNPRDTVVDTSKGRGWDLGRCRKLLFDCGFTHLMKGDGTKITLDRAYLEKTDSLF